MEDTSEYTRVKMDEDCENNEQIYNFIFLKKLALICLLGIVGIIIYIKYMSDYVCLALALFYPIYYLHSFKERLLNYHDLYLVFKYLFIYCHIEIIYSIFAVIGFNFCHIKFITILLNLCIWLSYPIIIDNNYNYISRFDKLMYDLICDQIKKYQNKKKIQ